MKIALIDSDSLLYICLYNKKDEIVKTLEQCKESIDLMISNIFKFTKATHYILTLTVGKNFRYTVKSDYKSNRKGEKPNYFNEIRQYLIDKYKAVFNENIESDDIVNIYKNNLENSFICACDSDILEGLEGTHFNYKTFKWITTSKDAASYKFWHDMIAGTHNGVSGLKGKGTVFADKVIRSKKSWDYRIDIFTAYLQYFNGIEDLFMDEFYKNYKCLKILDKYEGLVLIEPIEIIKEDYNLIE